MKTMETINKNPVKFTSSALEEVKRLIAAGQDEGKMLRVGVKGGGCSGMTYVLEFDAKADNDEVFETEFFTFIMNKAHGIYLTGMTVEWEGGLNSRGFTFINPNASSTCGCGTSFAV
jgi:iron-sulfur cluster assembly accessory protein